MSIETIISIIGFGIAVGAYYPLLTLKDRRREIAVVSLTAIICVVTAWYAVNRYQYDRELDYVSNKIHVELQSKALSFEDIQQKLDDVDASVISDAIRLMLRNYEIDADIFELKDHNGEVFNVRLYRVAKIEI